MTWKIPLADIDFGAEEEQAVLQVLKSGWLTMGEVTQQFEEEIAAYTGAKHAIAVSSATAALHLSCLVADLGPGDEALLPSLTFVATANAVRYVGATPVFVDIESEDSLNISPKAIESRITERTRAIIVVHYGGYACDMPAIMTLAEKHDLIVIEDAAHAIGSSLENRMLGTWGKLGCYSFFSNKNMTTGEGGMIVTDDDILAKRLRRLRSHGMTSVTWDRHKGHAWSYDVVGLGYNYRLDEMRSALGRVQLKKLPEYNRKRRSLTALYREILQELTPDIKIPFLDHEGESACHLLPALLPLDINRKRFMESMKQQGIQTSIHYPPIHHFTSYRSEKEAKAYLPVTEKVAEHEVTLPLYPGMTNSDVYSVVKAAQESFREQRFR